MGETIRITKGKYCAMFGGIGFQNNEAMLYPIVEPEHFNQVLCKNYREMAPGFMRTFGGYDDWTKTSMDAFAEYYEKMQKVTDTPIYFACAKGKIHFSEEEMRDYCERVADNLAYLKNEKGVKHLRYYCFSNEMSQGTWGDLLNDLPLFKKYHEMLYRAFQNRGLDIGLLATDASGDFWDTMDWAIQNMSRITAAFCLHTYEHPHNMPADFDGRYYDYFYQRCSELVDKAIRCDGKRVILGEIGLQSLDEADSMLTFYKNVVVDTCRYFSSDERCADSALYMADMIFAAINAGIYALGIWTYTDYPDPFWCAYSEKEGYAKKWGECEKFVSGTTGSKYNKWGMTLWEENGDYSPRPHYFCIAPLVKLFKRNTRVLDIDCDDKDLVSCGVQNHDGTISVAFVNHAKEPKTVTLSCSLADRPMRVYEYESRHVPYNRFCDIQPMSAVLAPDALTYELKPESVTFFTTDYIEKAATVAAKNVRAADGVLTWDEVADPNHCYYRVYASDQRGFKPSIDNQIASTVATALPIKEEKKYYKVLSVDQSGNV